MARFIPCVMGIIFLTGCGPAEVISPLQEKTGGELLEQFVGDWKLEVTNKPAEWTPKEIRYDVRDHATFILDGKFLQQTEVNHTVGEPEKVAKSLFLRNYDHETEKFTTWYFQSSGNMGHSIGTWDGNSRTFTHSNAETPPNISATTVETFKDDDRLDGSLTFKDNETGQTMFDMVWTRTRQTDVHPEKLLDEWYASGNPIKPVPEEVKKLQPFIGEWDSEFVHQPSVVNPEGGKSKGTMEAEWILDGHFLYGSSTAGKYRSMWVIGYDTNQQAYRYIRIDSDGKIEQNSGQWNEATRSFEWTLIGGQSGITRTSTNRIEANGDVHTRIIAKNSRGDVHMDLTIHSKRRK